MSQKQQGFKKEELEELIIQQLERHGDVKVGTGRDEFIFMWSLHSDTMVFWEDE